MTDTKRVHIFLAGRVQGVGFRAFIRKNANKLGVNGWAKNLKDGRVEAIFTGDREDVNELIELVKKGPRFADVSNFEIIEDIDKDFNDFQIKY